mgnify:CR=1 FL=1
MLVFDCRNLLEINCRKMLENTCCLQEPQFHDEELVWIEQTECLNPGDIGLFFLDGMTYFKKYVVSKTGTFLVSLNPDYAPKPVSEYSTFKIFGKLATD